MIQKLKEYIIKLENFYKKHEIKFLLYFIISFSIFSILNAYKYDLSDWKWYYYLYIVFIIIDSYQLFKLLKEKYKKA